MDFEFELSNYDVVELRDVLLKFLLKICESDIVAAISSYSFWLDNIELSSPGSAGFIYMDDEEIREKSELRTDIDAINNKLAGLYVTKEKEAKKELRESNWIRTNPNGNDIKASYYVEPGLNGIRICVTDIKSLNFGERGDLPSYLKKLHLKYFRFSIGVIWEVHKDDRLMKEGMFEFVDHERDSIYGRCDKSEFWFSISNPAGDYLEGYNDRDFVNHLNKVQKILDEVAPEKFELRPKLENLDLLDLGVLNRKGREFYSIDTKVFEEALNRFSQKLSDQAREKMKSFMKEIEKDIEEYKKKESKGDLRAKEIGERLQAERNVLESFLKYSDDLNKAIEKQSKA